MKIKGSNYILESYCLFYIHHRIGVAKATSAIWEGNHSCYQMCFSEFIKSNWQAGTGKTERGGNPNTMVFFMFKQMLCEN